MDLTPEQKKQLNAWSIKRDNILRAIGLLSTKLEDKEKKNVELSDSNTDLEKRIFISEGRILEIDKKEKERGELVSKDIAALDTRKSVLQVEVASLEKEVGGLMSKKNLLIEIIANAEKIHAGVFDQTSVLASIVEAVTRTSDKNISDFKTFFDELKKSMQEILDGNKNVIHETNKMIEKVPKVLKHEVRPVRIIRPVLNRKRLVDNMSTPKE